LLKRVEELEKQVKVATVKSKANPVNNKNTKKIVKKKVVKKNAKRVAK